MNPKIKKMWIEALRSGKYRMTTQQLRERSGKKVLYCVLGVLCELHRLATEEGEWSEDGEIYITGKSSSDLTPVVRRWAGIKGKTIRIPGPDGKKTDILSLNDDDNSLTFKKIASLIEASDL